MSISLAVLEPGIALLQVNRPEVRNALDWETIQKFSDYISQAHETPDLQALILSGSNDIFIAGGDLKKRK